jgi:adenylate cyclase
LIVATHSGAGRTDVRHTSGGAEWEMLIDPTPRVLTDRFFVGTAVPVAEIAAESSRLIAEAAAIALVVVLLAVAGVLAGALALSLSMRRVAARTARIRDLDFSAGEPVRSRIREIILLSDAVERMREALEVFGRYVAKDLVRQIMRSPAVAGVGGQRREVTVMFTDIEGFSRISEGIAPELLTGRLSRYFDALAGPISAHRGTIDKYIGDSVMAFWNAPEPDDQHVEHACRAALQAAAASRHLAQKWSNRGRPTFRTRFGVHAGPAVIGNVGARDRINYTLVGAVANQASRLEGLNKVYGTEILASGTVVERTAARFVWRPIDRVIPAGTSEAIDLCELLGEANDAVDQPFLDLWNEARGAYAAGEFAKAVGGFEAASELRSDDGPCRVMLQRCRALLQSPPSDWTGTWHFEVK